MKAAVYHGPGDVRIEQVPEPGTPGPGEVLLQVSMGSLCGTDASQYKQATMIPLLHPHPISHQRAPLILGHEVVGVIVEKGPDVAQLQVGQRVVPGAGWWCGECLPCREGRINICERYFIFGIHAHGGLAELAKFPAKMCQPVPDGCSDEAAAMAQACAVALHALLRGGIAPGQTVAIFGVGSIGSLLLATMMAQTGGAVCVIVVDVEDERLQNAERLGASMLINGQSADPVAAIHQHTSGKGVDVAIDASGTLETPAETLLSARKGGTVLQVGIPAAPSHLPLSHAVVNEINIVTTNGHVCGVDLPQALQLLATTDLAARVRHRVIALDALVPEGLVPLAAHRATAKILVDVLHAGTG
jgi:(R,R)-butanediol dehydrogenase / meso-butanediol dehydrogenase / diacetyl reductase